VKFGDSDKTVRVHFANVRQRAFEDYGLFVMGKESFNPSWSGFNG
jgi:hypothetical protein